MSDEESRARLFARECLEKYVEELGLRESSHNNYGLILFNPKLWECGLALFNQVRMMKEYPPYECMLYVSQLLPELLESINR